MIGTQSAAPQQRLGGRGSAVVAAARTAVAGCCYWFQGGVIGVAAVAVAI